MENLVIIIGIGILGAVIFLIFKQKNQSPSGEKENKLFFEYVESLRKEIRETGQNHRRELDKIQERIAKSQEHSSNSLQKQHEQSVKLIKDVTEQLTKIDATNKQVLGFSSQMQSLENILKNPKQRGILGEYFLEALLSQVFQPNQYQLQYKFKNGDIADAVIFFNKKVIPIDAKFSLEKYNKIMEEKDEKRREQLEKEFKMDIKNRIDETSKYILPKENTTEFAIMFIPAEGIYYNLLIYKVGSLNVNANDLIEYAFKKGVMIVSPTSFYAYLQTILQGLKALQMNESIKDVVNKVGDLGRHLGSYEAYMQKMGNSLGTTVNMYNSAYKEFGKIDKDIHKITEGESGGKADVLLIDKPSIEA
ncbi:DNA recombination protein RmuC [Candidatus Peregrinibacteria bacterium]|nr:DNA recombination protein RmuC [Candidatus Peregrinibacteria bacterium]